MNEKRKFRVLAALVSLTLTGAGAQSESSSVSVPSLVTRPLRIPMQEAGPSGLEALLVQPREPGRHPLAVITHGTPPTATERAAMTPQLYLPAALELARRGWTTVIIMRRGYGTSGGHYTDIASCDYPDYMRTARESAKDLRTAITFLSTFPAVDTQRIIAIGASGGGFAVIALTADPPPGLLAGINFSVMTTSD